MNILEKPIASILSVIDDANFRGIVTISLFMAVTLATMPLQLMTDSKSIGKLGFLSLLAVVIVLGIMAYETPQFRLENHILNDYKMFDFSNPLVFLQNIGIFIFSLYIFDCLFMIKKSMGKAATQQNLMKVGTTSVSIMYIPFAAAGVLGYASFGKEITGIDLFALRPSLAGSSDIAMKIGIVLIVLSLILSYNARVVALKQLIFEITEKELTWKRNVIFSTCLMFVPTLIAYVYPNVNDWVGL